jgi:hypothetical protein
MNDPYLTRQLEWLQCGSPAEEKLAEMIQVLDALLDVPEVRSEEASILTGALVLKAHALRNAVLSELVPEEP